MVNWISNWAQGIIIAIIIATIIEMILPNGNNKKYVKTVIGIYILFVIISPIVKAVTGDIDFSKLVDYEQYINSNTYQTMSNNIQINNTENIENIYKEKIKEDLGLKLKQKGYILKNISMNINLNENETQEYGKINSLDITIEKKTNIDEQDNQSSVKVNKIEKVNIVIGKTETVSDDKEQIPNDEIEQLKQYIYENYGVNKQNININ